MCTKSCTKKGHCEQCFEKAVFNTTSNTWQDENQGYWNILGSMQVKIVITKLVHMVRYNMLVTHSHTFIHLKQ